ncbi:MAG: adenylosuccinate lyase [Candidatus Gastranaerophilaceae bacterium]
MIERYSRKEISDIWQLDAKFDYYLQVELAVLKAYNKLGEVSDEALEYIKEHASFSVERIDEIEKEVKHDVIAFLTNVNENVGDKYSPLIHKGLTSSDVIDTAFALQIRDSAKVVLSDIDNLLNTLKMLADKYRKTICIGRSHGIGAEVITFGFKFLNHFDIFERAKFRIEYALKDCLRGQISGPVGSYSNISPEVEKLTCEELGLEPAKISTQIIARDVHAGMISAISILGSEIENLATEIRHLQRWEVCEVEEGFSAGQKGSSAMPHKKNPILSENLSGLARVLRGYSVSAFENITLWHERDISHSSVERIIFPDAFILADYMLNRLNNVLKILNVKSENMIKNVNKYGGIIYSQACLLKLTEKGMTREEAYSIVQKEALQAFNDGGNFKENMKKYLSDIEIDECFDEVRYLRNIDTIYKRFGL